jgi:hypothetical protein
MNLSAKWERFKASLTDWLEEALHWLLNSEDPNRNPVLKLIDRWLQFWADRVESSGGLIFYLLMAILPINAAIGALPIVLFLLIRWLCS